MEKVRERYMALEEENFRCPVSPLGKYRRLETSNDGIPKASRSLQEKWWRKFTRLLSRSIDWCRPAEKSIDSWGISIESIKDRNDCWEREDFCRKVDHFMGLLWLCLQKKVSNEEVKAYYEKRLKNNSHKNLLNDRVLLNLLLLQTNFNRDVLEEVRGVINGCEGSEIISEKHVQENYELYIAREIKRHGYEINETTFPVHYTKKSRDESKLSLLGSGSFNAVYNWKFQGEQRVFKEEKIPQHIPMTSHIIGIDVNNPKSTGRNLAAYQVGEKLFGERNPIVDTKPAFVENHYGIAMEKVVSILEPFPFKKTIYRSTTVEFRSWAAMTPAQLKVEARKRGLKCIKKYRTIREVFYITYEDPFKVFRTLDLGGQSPEDNRRIAKAQLKKATTYLATLDAITGESDRHVGNLAVVCVQREGRNVVTVKGFDNDQCFGNNKDSEAHVGKYAIWSVSLPSVIDRGIQERVAQFSAKKLKEATQGCVEGPFVEVAQKRTERVQKYCEQKLKKRNVVVIEENQWDSKAIKSFFKNLDMSYYARLKEEYYLAQEDIREQGFTLVKNE